MKTKLIISTIFMSLLFLVTGCNNNQIFANTPTAKTSYHAQTPDTSRINHEVPSTTRTGPEPTYKAHRFKNSTQYKMRSIQNHTINVQELSNGFYIPQFKGKIVLLRVFTKDSLHNPKELPMVHHLFSKYRHSMGVLAIQAGQVMDRPTAINLIKKYRMNYPIVEHSSASELLYTLKHDYNWKGQSSLTLLIKNGITEYTMEGSVDYRNLERKIQTLL